MAGTPTQQPWLNGYRRVSFPGCSKRLRISLPKVTAVSVICSLNRSTVAASCAQTRLATPLRIVSWPSPQQHEENQGMVVRMARREKLCVMAILGGLFLASPTFTGRWHISSER